MQQKSPALNVKAALLALILFTLVYALVILLAASIFAPIVLGGDGSDDETKRLRSEQAATVSQEKAHKDDILICETTKGRFRVTLDPVSSPNGVAELKRMVETGWLHDIAFFRSNDDIVQFGVREKTYKYKSDWVRDRADPDKKKRKKWERGVFAMIGGPHMIIVKRHNHVMGTQDHDTVAGHIDEEGMQVIDSIYRYNDIIDHPHGGPGPDQTDIYRHGWKYLNEQFPLVDRLIGCYLD
jgi:cyclophilin family peptidyl-prolyl cis-trans isomerase